MRMKNNRGRVLTCHMCSVQQFYGRTIKVIGLYSICDWCFRNIFPKFEEAFSESSE